MAVLKFEAVNSSNIAQIGYSKTEQLLEVKFRSGGHYRYIGVPAAIHKELMESESVGSAFNKIKSMFQFVRIN